MWRQPTILFLITQLKFPTGFNFLQIDCYSLNCNERSPLQPYLTLVTATAFTFPVCRTWGPLHRSIRGPHLYTVVVGVLTFSVIILFLNSLYCKLDVNLNKINHQNVWYMGFIFSWEKYLIHEKATPKYKKTIFLLYLAFTNRWWRAWLLKTSISSHSVE